MPINAENVRCSLAGAMRLLADYRRDAARQDTDSLNRRDRRHSGRDLVGAADIDCLW